MMGEGIMVPRLSTQKRVTGSADSPFFLAGRKRPQVLALATTAGLENLVRRLALHCLTVPEGRRLLGVEIQPGLVALFAKSFR
jgi:hypothetical protein